VEVENAVLGKVKLPYYKCNGCLREVMTSTTCTINPVYNKAGEIVNSDESVGDGQEH
jgi:hypothetical protein